MTTVLVEPAAGGRTYSVSFAYHADLVELIKLLPQRSRRWDKRAGVWRVDAGQISRLVGLLEINGCRIVGSPPSTAMDTARWADLLYAAVGRQRTDHVHRALTRVLHPDTSTGDAELMKQLNTARDRMAATR